MIPSRIFKGSNIGSYRTLPYPYPHPMLPTLGIVYLIDSMQGRCLDFRKKHSRFIVDYCLWLCKGFLAMQNSLFEAF